MLGATIREEEIMKKITLAFTLLFASTMIGADGCDPWASWYPQPSASCSPMDGTGGTGDDGSGGDDPGDTSTDPGTGASTGTSTDTGGNPVPPHIPMRSPGRRRGRAGFRGGTRRP